MYGTSPALLAHARVAARKACGLEREHQPHHLGLERFADPGAVRADEIELQLLELGVPDALVRELAKARIDPVDGFRTAGDLLHEA